MRTQKLLRFADLKARGIINSRPQLSRLTNQGDFPKGFLLGPNTRVWDEGDIDEWVEKRRHASSIAEAA